MGATGATGARGEKGDPTYLRTVVVGPGATPSASGAKLLDALAAIQPSAASPYVLQIEAGTYDLGATPLLMKQYVDLQGSGRDKTVITGVGSAVSFEQGATAVAAPYVQVRDLTILNTAGATYATALYASSDGNPELYTTFDNVILSTNGAVSGSDQLVGAYFDNAIAAFTDSTVTTGLGNFAIGLILQGAGGNVQLIRSSARAGSAMFGNQGVSLDNGFLTVTDGTVQASGPTSIAIQGRIGRFRITGSRILGPIGIVVMPGGGGASTIDRSTVSSLDNGGPAPFQVGASMVTGTVSSSGGGGIRCVYVYTAAYLPLNSTCT